MTLSASIPITQAEAANAQLAQMGYGPNNFSVPLRPASSPADTPATHVGFHCWVKDAFFDAVKAIPGVVWTDDNTSVPNFQAHKTAQAYDPKDAQNWYANSVMKGDRRTDQGKTWESLIDYNVWPPGVSGWREIVATGFPAWVQPTGAHDAYTLNAKVSHKGQNWNNTGSNANVWEPGVFGWVVIP